MQFPKTKSWLLGLLLTTVLISSCDDDDVRIPIALGSSITVTNTFQSNTIAGGNEQAIEDLFGVPAGSLAATANVGAAVEFPAYLQNLYDIDIDQNTIKFELVAQAGDPTYGSLFRELEAGTVDRYYLTFDEIQNVTAASSSDASVRLRIETNKVLVVEIGEGFDFQPGQSFTITLQ